MFATQMMKEAFRELDVPRVSYPGQLRRMREIHFGRRDVHNPSWRAWAKLKPLNG